MEHLLEVNNLCKTFKNFSLNNVSFSLPKGYIMGFIGPNGAGKSTTIKLIMNLLQRDKGTIKVFGLDNIQHEKNIKQKIGFVYDENYYYEDLTVGEMAKVISCFYEEWDQHTFNNYLREFQVSPKIKIKELSKGMKMKFSLAVALSHNAQLLIMDEPTSGLDPVVRSELFDILAWIIQDENKSIFFSTHIISDIEKIADYITFINQGQIVFSESKEAIFEKYALIKGNSSLLDETLRKKIIGLKEKKFGFEGLIDVTDNSFLKQREHFLLEKPTLEDIMLFIIKEDKV